MHALQERQEIILELVVIVRATEPAVVAKLHELQPADLALLLAEVARVIVFLLSPGANFISGNTIRIDGAASLGTRAWTLGKAQHSEHYHGFHRAYMPDVLKDQE